ncbi:MAG: RNA polymerase sigma factor [Verrucomicrobia bacterium]|nr:RNA polymerase sigma factor [Verrucomicrobiota bacterium]
MRYEVPVLPLLGLQEVDVGINCVLKNPNRVDQFESIVSLYYESLFRFALSLTKREADACDITQQTFYLWATKGQQLRDASKVKSWLFTTLYREFLGSRRRDIRFPHFDIESVDSELPATFPKTVADIDSSTVLRSLFQIDELYRAPLILFYLEEHSYREIASILNVPIGTVMSRLSRAKGQLRILLADKAMGTKETILPMNPATGHSTAQNE